MYMQRVWRSPAVPLDLPADRGETVIFRASSWREVGEQSKRHATSLPLQVWVSHLRPIQQACARGNERDTCSSIVKWSAAC